MNFRQNTRTLRWKMLIRIKLIFFLALCSYVGYSQEYSPEVRAQFVEDQEAYFQELRLSENQRLRYDEITRRYDKRLISAEISKISESRRKKIKKEIAKEKNEEMKRILGTDQYKIYLERQQEIEKKYPVTY